VVPVGVTQQQDLETADDRDRDGVDRDRHRIVEVGAEQRGREWQERHERQVDHVDPDQPVVELAQQSEELVVGDPVAPDHDEADEEADVGGLEVGQGIPQLALVGLAQLRHRDPDHQERHRDREQAVAERQHPRELIVATGDRLPSRRLSLRLGGHGRDPPTMVCGMRRFRPKG
jgi:hypothetical protein